MAKTPDYEALAKLQAELDKQAKLEQNMANRPEQTDIYGNKLSYTFDPTTGKWTQADTADPRVKAMIDQAMGTSGAMSKKLAGLANRKDFQTVKGAKLYQGMKNTVGMFNPNAGNVYGQKTAQAMLARALPQQAIDREQMETKLRLQGLQPGSEAYDRAYQNLLRSQGDVNAQTRLEGWLAGQNQARENYNTRLQGYLGESGAQRSDYQAMMQGQNQMNDQAMKSYLMPYDTMGQMQTLNQGMYSPYTSSYQGFGTAAGSTPADMYNAAQDRFAQQQQNENDRRARNAQIGSALGTAVGSYFGGSSGGAAGGAVGGAFGSWASDKSLKDDISVISDEDAYNAMMRLHPHSFTWPSGARDAGLIAQEVEREFPDLITQFEQGYKMVNYPEFTALLLGAFRHLAKKSRGMANHG